MNNKLKKIIIIASTAIALIIVISIYFIIDNASKTATVTFMIAPLSAEVKLNGQSYNTNDTYRIKPGNYTLSIEKNGYFEPYYEEFIINDNETKDFYISLEPIEGTDWYELHPEDSMSLDAIIDEEETIKSDYIEDNYPLFGILPISVDYYDNESAYVYYIISYDLTDYENPIVLIKDYTGGNYENALNRIRLEGYNPENYTIEYRDESEDYLDY